MHLLMSLQPVKEDLIICYVMPKIWFLQIYHSSNKTTTLLMAKTMNNETNGQLPSLVDAVVLRERRKRGGAGRRGSKLQILELEMALQNQLITRYKIWIFTLAQPIAFRLMGFLRYSYPTLLQPRYR